MLIIMLNPKNCRKKFIVFNVKKGFICDLSGMWHTIDIVKCYSDLSQLITCLGQTNFQSIFV